MKRFAKAGMLAVLVAALSAVVVFPAGATGDRAPRCDEGHWPAGVQGKPLSFEPGGRAGFYTWHDASGWHLRTTTPQRYPHVFTGTIVSADDIKVVHQFRDEGRDSVQLDGNTLTFTFVTYNGVDGVDLKVGCTESLTFSLKVLRRPMPVERIWLGATGHARTNPFTITRI